MKKARRWVAGPAVLTLLLAIWTLWPSPKEPSPGVRLVMVAPKPTEGSPKITTSDPKESTEATALADAHFTSWRDTFVDDLADVQTYCGLDPFTVVCDDTVCINVFQNTNYLHDFVNSLVRRPQIVLKEIAVKTFGAPTEVDRCNTALQERLPKSWHSHVFEVDDQMCMATAPPFRHNQADYDRHIKAGFALCQSAVRDDL